MAHLGTLGQRQRLRKTLPPTHKEKDENALIELDNREKAMRRRRRDEARSSKRKSESSIWSSQGSEADYRRSEFINPSFNCCALPEALDHRKNPKGFLGPSTLDN